MVSWWFKLYGTGKKMMEKGILLFNFSFSNYDRLVSHANKNGCLAYACASTRSALVRSVRHTVQNGYEIRAFIILYEIYPNPTCECFDRSDLDQHRENITTNHAFALARIDLTFSLLQRKKHLRFEERNNSCRNHGTQVSMAMLPRIDANLSWNSTHFDQDLM